MIDRPIPIDRVRFFNARLACEVFSVAQPIRTPKDGWDALIDYADGRCEYYQFQAESPKELANQLRKRGVL